MGEPRIRLYVVAGCFGQFRNWLMEHPSMRNVAHYVETVDQIRGLRDFAWVGIGTYRERKDYGVLLEAIWEQQGEYTRATSPKKLHAFLVRQFPEVYQ